ncbi:hypothetical protein [Legionella fallonii]|uniref:Peptidase C80 domain-containing protein n=1 Tax=Legionella fallonii LLAP-10 TaxID=1212491 RepID=A0A098G4R9_9GAMM|nr:hypothetical protein [Legionella fallonii]CEG56989.1 protein of unknown function [Legionella fallonii LLAP-10]
MTKKNQELLIDAINNLGLDIPSDVFHFDFNRTDGQKYLEKAPSIPCLIRKSSVDGCFALDRYDPHRDTYSHLLIVPPKTENEEFKFCHYENGVMTEISTLSAYLNVANIPTLKWQQLKTRLEQHPPQKNAVMSIQSLDQQVIALNATQVDEYARDNPSVKKSGDGHTGLAIAQTLHAPFVVVRTEGNRAEANKVLEGHLVNNGLLVLTGHGNPDGNMIAGNYLNKDQMLFVQQRERGSIDIVSSALEAGLKSGDQINILLSICYGAADTQKNGNSFAHKLAKEFAKHGISTTIIASVKPVHRFGTGAIEQGKLTFTNEVGMAPTDIRVFSTQVDTPNANPVIDIYKPNEIIQLSREGFKFINPYKPIAQSSTSKDDAPQNIIITPTPLSKITQQPELVEKQQRLEKEKQLLEQQRLLEKEKQQRLEQEKQCKEQQNTIDQYKAKPEIAKLFNAIKNMENYGEKLLGIGADKGTTAISLAKELDKKLVDFLLKSSTTPPTQEQFEQFKADFKGALHDKDDVMHQHREQWKPIVANILLALSGIGLIAIIIKATAHVIDASLNKKQLSFNQAFFFAKTQSQELGDKIDESLEDTSLNSTQNKN